jgi:hypothetical protein
LFAETGGRAAFALSELEVLKKPSKDCFLEKRQQKTFVNSASALPGQAEPKTPYPASADVSFAIMV